MLDRDAILRDVQAAQDLLTQSLTEADRHDAEVARIHAAAVPLAGHDYASVFPSSHRAVDRLDLLKACAAIAHRLLCAHIKASGIPIELPRDGIFKTDDVAPAYRDFDGGFEEWQAAIHAAVSRVDLVAMCRFWLDQQTPEALRGAALGQAVATLRSALGMRYGRTPKVRAIADTWAFEIDLYPAQFDKGRLSHGDAGSLIQLLMALSNVLDLTGHPDAFSTAHAARLIWGVERHPYSTRHRIPVSQAVSLILYRRKADLIVSDAIFQALNEYVADREAA